MKKEQKRKNLKPVRKGILALAIAISWLVCVYFICGIYFETNDDKLLTEILSGVVTAQPEGHAVYMNYLLAKPLSLLYRFLPEISWYGFFLILVYVLVYSVIFCALFRNSERKKNYIAGGFIVGVSLLCTLRVLSNITFTTAAAFLAIGGYAYLLLEKNGGKGKTVLFLLLEGLSFLLRENAMLMLQPIGIAVWCGFQLGNRDIAFREKIKRQLEVILTVLFIVSVGTFADWVAYRSPEWKEYMSFKEARETLFDFYGTPEYLEVKGILDKYGVTEAEYTAYTHYVILDYDVSAECAQELAEYVKANRVRDKSFSSNLCQIAEQRFRGEYSRINKVSTAIWIMMFVWIIIQKSYHLLLPVTGLGISETVVWYFMIWRGRIPWRVTAPLFLCDIFILTILLWKEFSEKKVHGTWRYGIFAGMLGVMLWNVCLSGLEQYKYVVQENRGCEILSQSMYEIEEYCRANPENRYLLGANSMIYFRGAPFDTRLTLTRNSVVTGNWFSNSPPSRRYLKNYLGENAGGIYLIVYAEAPIDFAALDYLEEKTKCAPIETDSFTTTSGAVYAVYCFGEEG
ncbi:MAG: hypothetical protein ACI4AB_03795 [Acetatifactor sp.]